MTIKHIRYRTGMTQKSFSEFFGIPTRTIESWEMGERKCPSYVLELIKYKLKKEGKFTLRYYYAKNVDYNCVLVVDKNDDTIVLHDGVIFEKTLSKETAIEELIENQPNSLIRCRTIEEIMHSIGADFEVFRFEKIKDKFESIEEL